MNEQQLLRAYGLAELDVDERLTLTDLPDLDARGQRRAERIRQALGRDATCPCHATHDGLGARSAHAPEPTPSVARTRALARVGPSSEEETR